MTLEWFTVFFSVVTAGIGYYARHIIEKRKELQNEVNVERRAVYQKFVDIIVEDLHSQSEPDKQDFKKVNDAMFDFYKKYMLYASPDVINAMGNYRQYNFALLTGKETMNPRVHYENLSKVLLEMREDLGLSNKNLGDNGERAFKTMLMDYHDYFN